MTDRDWEAAARRRLEHLVADTVSRVRDTAEEIEREARRNIEKAAQADRLLSFHTYPRVAAQVVHSVHTMVFNLHIDALINAANDAEAARTEKLTAIAERTSATAQADKLAGAVKALEAMREMAKGWAQGSAENDMSAKRYDRKSADEQEFVLSDILAMINDAAREVGVEVKS